MSNTARPAPGFRRHPQHQVRVSANDMHWVASLNGKQLAASQATLAVDETGYERVIYFPQQDVNTDELVTSDSRSTCPFKGEAQYYAAEIDGEVQDVGWFYPSAYDEVAAIEGYVAFYTNRVDLSSNYL